MQKLIDLLKYHARLSNEQLAVMLGTTEAAVEAEIANLEEEGIIKGYGAIIDEERLNLDNVTAYIEVKVSPKPDHGFDEIATTIMQYEGVESVYLMSGGYDLSVTITGNNLRDVALFVSERLSALDGILSTATHFVLRRYKDKGVVFTTHCRDERGLVSP